MGRKGFVYAFFIALIVLNVLAWNAVFDSNQAFLLKVVFFDIGQGDAVFIETPQKHQILIDGGPDAKILEKLGKEMPFYDRSIDLVILTHPEKDHLAGLIDVLKHYQIDYVLWTGVVRDTQEYQEWLKAIEVEQEQGAQIKIAQFGQKIFAGNAEFFILHPFESLAEQTFKDSNNTSVVVKLLYGQNDFLFTGDIYQSKEKELVERIGDTLDSDVLKISHHGSKTSSEPEFIQQVSPKISVIQCQKNNTYGHPHEQTLETLINFGGKILRTDQNEDIYILTDGKSLTEKLKAL